MIAKNSVMLATIHPGKVTYGYHTSVVGLAVRELTSGDSRLRGTLSAHGSLVASERNEVVWNFMRKAGIADAQGAPPIDWLLFIDSDIVFEPDILDAFADALAQTRDARIMSGLYFSHFTEVSPDGSALQLPVWFEDRSEQREFVLDPLDGPDVRPLAGCGMGVCLIHKSVFRDMLLTHPDDNWPWFGHDLAENGKRLGEDLTFCARSIALGYQVFGAKTVQVRHIKEREVDARTYVQPIEQAATTLSEAV